MNYNIRFSCVSHVGKSRKINQDNFLCNGYYMQVEKNQVSSSVQGEISLKNNPVIMGIFDGLGGEECGEVASYIAARNFSRAIFSENIIFDLEKLYFDTNEKICDYITENQLRSMGTTAAALVFAKKEIILSNIGDSKIFLFSNKKLEQISKDHVIDTLMFVGKSPLTQNLGIPSSELIIEPYIARGYYNKGDVYLICSDGLTDMLTMKEIENILSNHAFEKVSSILLDRALENGGKDNITIIVCQITNKLNCLLKRLVNKRMRKVYGA